MRKKRYREQPWMSPKVEIRNSPVHGKGMFAVEALAQGKLVVVWRALRE